MRSLAGEALGTFILVFVGTGACVVDSQFGGVGHVGICLAFGLAVFAVIEALGPVSGAHINPAVTIGFWWAGRFPAGRVPGYVLAQLFGAAAASGLLHLLFPTVLDLGSTRPHLGLLPSLILEMVITFLLMLVILGVTTGAKEEGLFAGLSIGATVATLALFAGPATGASMNPARSFGPALAGGQWEAGWLYWLGPVLGAMLAAPLCRFLHPEKCCTAEEKGPAPGEND